MAINFNKTPNTKFDKTVLGVTELLHTDWNTEGRYKINTVIFVTFLYEPTVEMHKIWVQCAVSCARLCSRWVCEKLWWVSCGVTSYFITLFIGSTETRAMLIVSSRTHCSSHKPLLLLGNKGARFLGVKGN